MLNRKSKNRIRVRGDIAYVDLGRGASAIVDREDVELVSQFVWCRGTRDYPISRRNGRRLRLPRLLLDLAPGQVVDHINRNPLDNRRCNLRVCTQAENVRNSRPKGDGFKGVCKSSRGNRWRAVIKLNYQQRALGQFATAEEAALAYDKAAKELFGEFAYLNFPERGQ